jgi:hypothetical protein
MANLVALFHNSYEIFALINAENLQIESLLIPHFLLLHYKYMYDFV